MTKLFYHFHNTRYALLHHVRAVSAYFSSGGGDKVETPTEPPKLAWTSEDQKQRSKEFFELAGKLANNRKDDKAA